MSKGYENINDQPDPLVDRCFESPKVAEYDGEMPVETIPRDEYRKHVVDGAIAVTRDSQYVPADEVDRLLMLAESIKTADAELKELKAEYADLESFIVEQWAAIGKQSESRRGKTIFRKREFQCSTKAGQGDALKDAVEANGLGQFVNESVTIGSLKSWIRERLQYTEDGELDLSQVPTAIAEKLNVHERFVVGIRNS